MNFIRRLFGGSSTETDTSPAQSPTDDEVYQPAPTTPLAPPIVQDTPSTAEDQQPITAPLATRPLTPPQEFESSSRQLRIGQRSDVGRTREINQDACLTLFANAELTGDPPAIGFYVVADGMGGHTDGEIASAITVQTLAKEVTNDVIMPHIQRRTGAQSRTIPEVLADAVQAANEAVQEQVPEGGTTATAIVIRGDLAYIAHVGDSRAYLITGGNMEVITRDHSLVKRLIELGQLTPEEAETHPQRNVLYRAIGQGEQLEVDAATRRLPPSSRLLICSDGLWGVVGDERMGQVLASTSDPQEACDKLIDMANEAGGPDSITAILIQMPD